MRSNAIELVPTAAPREPRTQVHPEEGSHPHAHPPERCCRGGARRAYTALEITTRVICLSGAGWRFGAVRGGGCPPAPRPAASAPPAQPPRLPPRAPGGPPGRLTHGLRDFREAGRQIAGGSAGTGAPDVREKARSVCLRQCRGGGAGRPGKGSPSLREAVPVLGRHGPAPLLEAFRKKRPSGGPERVPGGPGRLLATPGRPGPARVARQCRCWVATGRRPSWEPV